MKKNRQNNFLLSDDYFSKLDEWDRSEERKETTKKRVRMSLGKQKIPYRPYVFTFAAGVLLTILVMSILPTIMMNNNEASYVMESSGENIKEYYKVNQKGYQSSNAWIATITKTPIIVKYDNYNEREVSGTTVFYKVIGEDMLNMAFYHNGETYTIHYNLASGNEKKAFILVEEEIEKIKSQNE